MEKPEENNIAEQIKCKKCDKPLDKLGSVCQYCKLIKKKVCGRCGRNTHKALDCFAQKHIKGHELADNAQNKCTRCNRNGHRVADCLAFKDIDGQMITK